MTQVGDFIDGRYEVVRKIGEGGMSEVWLVDDKRLKKMQAIKEIKKNASNTTHHVLADRIKIEASIMMRLDHPNIVKVTDYIDDGKVLYIVMEYIQGRDMRDLLKEHGGYTEEDVAAWGVQLCEALGYLHQEGVIYRDMKPGNIMLMDNNTVKIIDFGIAREYSAEKTDDTMPLGTRGYASPEAFISNRQTDARSDIYSLGVTLFHLATGHGPLEFLGDTVPPIRDVDASFSEGFEKVLQKSMQAEPDDRYQTCDDFAYWLIHRHDLDAEHVNRLKRIISTFRILGIAGLVCLVVGIGCLVGSSAVRASSYNGLRDQAEIASAAEMDGEASERERLYLEAIEINPGSIDSYFDLLDTYEDDGVFSGTEARRWSNLFSERRDAISGSDRFAELCYEAGMLYFINYEDDNDLVRGESAAPWFNLAISNYDEGRSTLSAEKYNAASAYKIIGDFKKTIDSRVEDEEEEQAYQEYWGALETVLGIAQDDSADENVQGRQSDATTLSRARLCSVVRNILASPEYLQGFRSAGVAQSDAEAMLSAVYDVALELSTTNGPGTTAGDLCQSVIDGYDSATSCIDSVYNNAGVKHEGSGSSGASSSREGGAQ